MATLQPLELPPAPAPFGASAIAADWSARGAPASRQLVSRYVLHGVRGSKCPTSSLADAWAWRQTHTKVRAPEKTRAITTTTTHQKRNSAHQFPPPRTRPPPDAPADASLESSLARARAIEAEQYQLWCESIIQHCDAAEQSLRIRAHRDAMSARLEAEKRVVEHLQSVGSLVSLEAAQEIISQRLSSLRAARAALPRSLALVLFPEAPQRAQLRIEEELRKTFDPAAATAAQPLISAPEASPPTAIITQSPPVDALHSPPPARDP